MDVGFIENTVLYRSLFSYIISHAIDIIIIIIVTQLLVITPRAFYRGQLRGTISLELVV